LYYFSCSGGIDYVRLGTTDSLLTFQTGGNNTLCVMIMIIDDNNIEPATSLEWEAAVFEHLVLGLDLSRRNSLNLFTNPWSTAS